MGGHDKQVAKNAENGKQLRGDGQNLEGEGLLMDICCLELVLGALGGKLQGRKYTYNCASHHWNSIDYAAEKVQLLRLYVMQSRWVCTYICTLLVLGILRIP